jgi:hypothetical protein
MKRQFACLVAAGVLFTLASQVQAGSYSGHYPAGVEGIKGGSLPPPGLYLRDYNLFYTADKFPDIGPPGFDGFVYVQAPRLVWITDFQILGGNYGMDALFPFYDAYVNTDLGGIFPNRTFGLGDIFVEPITLSWHGAQYDLGLGYGFWTPNGEYNDDHAHPSRLLGQGFWSHMFTLGGTWYPDAAKTWSASLLSRYEIHSDHPDADYTVGDTFTLEWGLSKALSKTVEVGVAGYYQAQVTGDDGPASRGIMDHVVGVGPEVVAFCPKLGMFASLRYIHELESHERPQGDTFTLTLTVPLGGGPAPSGK